MQKLTAVAKVCQTQEGATDADVQEVINRVQPTTDTSKCLRACMFETFGSVCFQLTRKSKLSFSKCNQRRCLIILVTKR